MIYPPQLLRPHAAFCIPIATPLGPCGPKVSSRIDTIIDSDRILVMDAGAVAEFDTPAALLRDEGSIFTQLCRQLGGDSFGGLRAAAERHEELLEVLAGEVRAAEEARISTGVSGISLPGI